MEHLEKVLIFPQQLNSDQTGSSMSSELLDDYEEGSWTPGNSDMGITNHYAYYTKVGYSMVHIVMDITFASSPADSSQVGYVTQNYHLMLVTSHNMLLCSGLEQVQ